MEVIYICEIFFKQHTDEAFKKVITESNLFTYKRKKKALIEDLQANNYIIEQVKESKYYI